MTAGEDFLREAFSMNLLQLCYQNSAKERFVPKTSVPVSDDHPWPLSCDDADISELWKRPPSFIEISGTWLAEWRFPQWPVAPQ
jgi:hypothetical protein